MDLVTLKNGNRGLEPLVKVVMLSLGHLFENDPIVFYELTMKCRDENHSFFGKTGDVLKELKLIEPDGSTIDMVRDVVLSAVTGDMLEMTLGSPFADEQPAEPTSEPVEETLPISAEEKFEQDYALFVMMHSIGDMVFEYYNTSGYSEEKPTMEDRRKEGSNPFYNQTRSGLFLEEYYGSPSKLWTPWGYWQFGGGGGGIGSALSKARENVMARLGYTVYKELENNNMGSFGPVYAITSFDGEELPNPVALSSKKEFMAYEDADKYWNALNDRYMQEHPAALEAANNQ